MKPNLDKRPIVLRQVEFLANNLTRVGTVVAVYVLEGALQFKVYQSCRVKDYTVLIYA